MTVHQFNYPTTILYGAGALAELANRLSAGDDRFLLVTDPGLVKVGLADRVRDALRAAGAAVEIFSDVHPNPVEADVRAGVDSYRACNASCVIALGGGSPMDAAKAIAVAATHDGPMSKFDDSKGGDKYIDNPLPGIYAIPTTAGTGSEVGRCAVIIAEDTKVKTVIFHPDLLPRIAVLDPELTTGLPKGVTAATGMDAFSHCIETYFAKGFHPMADAIALGGMEMVIEYLPRAHDDGADLHARGQMLIAASMGATAFQKGLGMIHSLAHPLSTRYGIHHGLANALLMPPVFAWQLDAKRDQFSDDLHARYQRVARLFASDAGAADLSPAIAGLCKRVGIEQTLAGLGLVDADIPALAAEAFNDPCHSLNPIAMTTDDLAAAYRACL